MDIERIDGEKLIVEMSQDEFNILKAGVSMYKAELGYELTELEVEPARTEVRLRADKVNAVVRDLNSAI